MAAEVVSDSVPNPADAADQAGRYRPEDSGHDQSGQIAVRGRSYANDPKRQAVAPTAPRSLSLSIIMAAFNEERTIAQAVHEVLGNEFPCDIELIIVNDGSTDRTPDLLADIRDPRVIVYHHKRNRGKGAALRSAAEIATGTYVLPFDADLEYAVEDVTRMLDPVLKGRCRVVYGVRLFGYNTVYRSYRYAMGNKTLTRLANVLFDACLSDLHTCLKLIPTELLRSMHLSETGFGLDTEITASLLRVGVRPFEVPVSYFGRSHAEGKKITWRDAVACVWILLRVRLGRRKNRLSSERLFAELAQDIDRGEHGFAGADTSLLEETGEETIRVAG